MAHSGTNNPESAFSNDANTAIAKLNSTNALVVSVFNPLAWAREATVVPALSGLLQAPPSLCASDGASGNALQLQTVHDSLRKQWTVYVQVPSIPALGITTLLLRQASGSGDCGATPQHHAHRPAAQHVESSTCSGTTLSNGNVTLVFDNTTGVLCSWSVAKGGAGDGATTTHAATQQFLRIWERNPTKGLFSGTNVYAFVRNTEPLEVLSANSSSPVQLSVDAQGPLVWQASQVVTPYLGNTVRLFATSGARHVLTAPSLSLTLQLPH